MSVLRVGINGAGGIASGVHIPSYLNSGNKGEIVAITDDIVERAQQVAELFTIPHVFAYLPEVNGHQLEINQFVECCLEGKTPLSTPEQGLIIQKIVNAIYESAETGNAIQF